MSQDVHSVSVRAVALRHTAADCFVAWLLHKQSPGEAVRAFLRVGYEISRLIRCSGVARRDVAGSGRSGTHSSECGPAFPRRLCATATGQTSRLVRRRGRDRSAPGGIISRLGARVIGIRRSDSERRRRRYWSSGVAVAGTGRARKVRLRWCLHLVHWPSSSGHFRSASRASCSRPSCSARSKPRPHQPVVWSASIALR